MSEMKKKFDEIIMSQLATYEADHGIMDEKQRKDFISVMRDIALARVEHGIKVKE